MFIQSGANVRRGRGAVGVPAHPKGVQWGRDQSSVQFFHSNLGESCLPGAGFCAQWHGHAGTNFGPPRSSEVKFSFL